MLVAIHSLLLVYCAIVAISTPHDAQWGLVWWPMFIVDLPITLLQSLMFSVVPDGLWDVLENLFHLSSAAFPFRYMSGFWFPLVSYGILGTALWYFLPVFMVWLKTLVQARTD